MTTALVYAPFFLAVALTAALFLWWARRTSLTWLRLLLRIHAWGWLITLVLITSALVFAMETCGGTALYGFQNCTYMRGTTANYAFPAFLFGYAAAIGCSVLITLIGTVAEWRHHKTR